MGAARGSAGPKPVYRFTSHWLRPWRKIHNLPAIRRQHWPLPHGAKTREQDEYLNTIPSLLRCISAWSDSRIRIHNYKFITRELTQKHSARNCCIWWTIYSLRKNSVGHSAIFKCIIQLNLLHLLLNCLKWTKTPISGKYEGRTNHVNRHTRKQGR